MIAGMTGGRPVHSVSDAPTLTRRRVRFFAAGAAALGALLGGAGRASAQTEYTLDEDGEWVARETPAPGSDAAVMAEARKLLADGKASEAKGLLSGWIENHEETANPYLADAYFLRGDARTATGDEYWALYDYEEIARNFRSSDLFEKSVEREFEIGKRYLNGLKTRIFWIRLEDASSLGEEIMLRVSERMPGSVLAEKALLELADFYYRTRDLSQAAEAYGIFRQLYPKSQFREKAMQREVFANIARFKGPDYDASGLVEAGYLIRNFSALYPAEAERAGMSDALVARLDESAAAQMLRVAEWYMGRDDPVSARFTLKRLQRKHPQTVAAAKGREIMAEKGWLPPSPEAPEQGVEGEGITASGPVPIESPAAEPRENKPATGTPAEAPK